MSAYPVNPRNKELSRCKKKPFQLWTRNACTRATIPLNMSSQPNARMVTKVAVMSPARQTRPDRISTIPRNKNHPHELRTRSKPERSEPSSRPVAIIFFLDRFGLTLEHWPGGVFAVSRKPKWSVLLTGHASIRNRLLESGEKNQGSIGHDLRENQ